jgi:hypothetical protein
MKVVRSGSCQMCTVIMGQTLCNLPLLGGWSTVVSNGERCRGVILDAYGVRQHSAGCIGFASLDECQKSVSQ